MQISCEGFRRIERSGNDDSLKLVAGAISILLLCTVFAAGACSRESNQPASDAAQPRIDTGAQPISSDEVGPASEQPVKVPDAAVTSTTITTTPEQAVSDSGLIDAQTTAFDGSRPDGGRPDGSHPEHIESGVAPDTGAVTPDDAGRPSLVHDFFSTVWVDEMDSISLVSMGDLWANCWSDDDNVYTTSGDGTGFGSTLADIVVSRIEGRPEDPTYPLRGVTLA
jgi:hypothetical protein